jgi:c-di-GMP phosphodiesterase
MEVPVTQIFLARQPIFDITLVPVGYELLYRHDPTINAAYIYDRDEASSQILFNTFTTLGVQQVTGNLPAYVNLSRQILLTLDHQSFPKDQMIIEVLENVGYDDTLYDALLTLKKNGFTIALDDFVYSTNMDRFIDLSDIIKIDVLATPLEAMAPLVSHLQTKPLKLIAEKIETSHMLKICQKLEMHYFQGYYLGRPEMIKQ